MKRMLAALAFWLTCALPAAAATLEELTPYLTTQYFTWEEHQEGRRLLRERGALTSLGVVLGLTQSSFCIRAKGELFGGEVGYNGTTQAPESEPIRTDVGYFGIREELDLGYRMQSGAFRLEPFAGLGHRWWLRDLQDTASADGSPVQGYTESWQTVYGRFGARGQTGVGSRIKVVAEGGVKYPFYTGNSVDFAGSGKTTFHPEARWSGFAETGFSYRNLNMTLLYEGFRFGASPLKPIQNRYYFQPQSSSDIFGLRVGWTF